MYANLQTSLDALMSAQYPEHQPGAALLVYAQGKVLYEKGFGLADLETGTKITPNTTFRLASVSKQFTAMCIQLLEQRGLLSYNANLRHFFPEFNQIGAGVTLWHLLTHTSGLLDYEEFVEGNTERQVTDLLVLQITANTNSTYFEPGTQYRYSNTGFVLLALVVEQVAGIPYASFLQQNIFEPLEMHHTILYGRGKIIQNRAMGYSRNAKGELVFSDQGTCTATMGDGCIYTSVRDYLQWHKALGKAGALNVEPVLETLSHTIEGNPNWLYGMGWFFSKRESGGYELYHTGNTSGFSNLVIRIPENDVLIAYFSNMADNPHLLTGFLDVLEQFPLLRPEAGLVRELLALTR